MFEFLLWKDHAVSPSNTYKLTKNNDDTYTLTPVGKVIQQGTNMSAANFNRMEVGLHDVNIAVKIAQIIIQRLVAVLTSWRAAQTAMIPALPISTRWMGSRTAASPPWSRRWLLRSRRLL